MTRALFVALAVMCGSAYPSAQQVSVLHIRAVLLDANGKPTAVPNHALLISDEPPSAPPRRVVLRPDGTADVTLRPGTYAVESDRPVAFQGRVYEWAQRITMSAGRDASLELNARNAEEAASPTSHDLESDPVFLLNRWDGSVAGIWTPLAHGSGIIVDAANGLVATNAQLAASASDIQVQLTPEITVRARIVVADSNRDVAILQIHPSLTASILPLAPDCAAPSGTLLARGQELFAIAAPLRGPKDLASGTVVGIDAQEITVDLGPAAVSAGGPAFANGRLAGITSVATSDVDANGRRWASRVVGVDALCAGLASAQKTIREGVVPDATHLPVDPARSFPVDALKEIVARRAGGLSPPQMSFADFDVAFITPVHTFGAQLSPFGGTRQRVGLGLVDVGSPELRPVRDFANWSDYVKEYLPVLLYARRRSSRRVSGRQSHAARL